MRKRNSDERGQSMVLVTLTMVGLIAFLALVIDGGIVFAERREMQNAADAAALAGTRQLWSDYEGDRLPDDEKNILKAVHAYAEANGVEDSNGTPDDGVNDNVVAYFIDDDYPTTLTPIGEPLPNNGGIPYDAVGVEVTTSTSFGSFFARVIGRNELAASAVAAAILTPGITMGDHAIWSDSYVCNNALNLSGSDTTIVGHVHSNSDVYVHGGSIEVEGSVSFCDEIKIAASGQLNATDGTPQWPPPMCQPDGDNPKPWTGLNIDIGRFDNSFEGGPLDFAWVADQVTDDSACQGEMGGVEQTTCYHYFDGNLTKLEKDETWLDGLYYVEGDVSVNGNDFPDDTMTITIVATGKIKMVNIDASTIIAYSDLDDESREVKPDFWVAGDLLLFSNKDGGCAADVLDISTSATEWMGLIFAPLGGASISASDESTIWGAVWAYTVNLSGAYKSISWSGAGEDVEIPEFYLVR